jgi:hypothetical protein
MAYRCRQTPINRPRGRTLERLGGSPATRYQKSLSCSPGPDPAKDGRDPQLPDSDLYSLLSRGKTLIIASSLGIITLQTSKNVYLILPLKCWLDLS